METTRYWQIPFFVLCTDTGNIMPMIEGVWWNCCTIFHAQLYLLLGICSYIDVVNITLYKSLTSVESSGLNGCHLTVFNVIGRQLKFICLFHLFDAYNMNGSILLSSTITASEKYHCIKWEVPIPALNCSAIRHLILLYQETNTSRFVQVMT